MRAQVEKLAVQPRRLVLVLLANTSDVIISATGAEIEAQFQQQKGRVLFSGDRKCRPEEKLADDFPKSTGYRFLSSNGRSLDIQCHGMFETGLYGNDENVKLMHILFGEGVLLSYLIW